GIDNESTITLPDLITASLNKQIPLYTLGFGSADEYLLNAMSTQTGGRYYYAPDISTLQNLFSLISGQLKNLYRVSWVYDNPACPQVLMIVEVNYTCKNGSFTAKTEKIFSPLVK
ncbi:MAG: hypothetical protein WCK34_15510, partial [Bacteroidota bacterium]